MQRRGIFLYMVAYNLFPEEGDGRICRDTEDYLRGLLEKEFPEAKFEEVPYLEV